MVFYRSGTESKGVYDMDQIKHMNLDDEEHVIEGIRALVRLIARTVLEELPPVETEKRKEEAPGTTPEKARQTTARRGLIFQHRSFLMPLGYPEAPSGAFQDKR